MHAGYLPSQQDEHMAPMLKRFGSCSKAMLDVQASMPSLRRRQPLLMKLERASSSGWESQMVYKNQYAGLS